MNNIIKPILKRQLLIMGSGTGIYFLIAHFFGFFIGFMANTIFFVGVIFYIRRRNIDMYGSSLFSYRDTGNNGKYTAGEMTKLKYICYPVVQRLKTHNAVNVVLKLESYYFRSIEGIIRIVFILYISSIK